MAYGNVSPLTISLPQDTLFATEAVLSSGLSCIEDGEVRISLLMSFPVIECGAGSTDSF
jgi:hypothetical protein